MRVFTLIRPWLLIMALFALGAAPALATPLHGAASVMTDAASLQPVGGCNGRNGCGGRCNGGYNGYNGYNGCNGGWGGGGWCIGCRFYERWDPYYGGYTSPYLHRPWSWYDYGYWYDRPFRYYRVPRYWRAPRYLYDWGGI